MLAISGIPDSKMICLLANIRITEVLSLDLVKRST